MAPKKKRAGAWRKRKKKEEEMVQGVFKLSPKFLILKIDELDI